MRTAYDIWEGLKSLAKEQGLETKLDSGLRDLNKTSKMISAVKTYLTATDHDASDESAEKVLRNSIENLTKSWHAYDLEAQRACDRYFKQNPGGIPKGPTHGSGGHGSGSDPSGSGHGEGSGSSGEGSGEGTIRQGGGSGQGQGDGEGSEGEGEGSGGSEGGQSEGEGSEGEGEGGEGQGTPQPQPQPDPTPVPPPADPDYIKPAVWDKVMRIVMWNMEHPGKQKNIMLVGPRGIGKTELVIQINKALAHVYPNMQKFPFTITSPQAKHEVCGYGNAMGEAVRTEFTKGYVQQSIVLIEEIDRSEPTALIAINAATANKIMDTPVIGMIEQHPLCTIIATANTAGIGATEEYITANQLDASTRDRYIYIEMDFDKRIATKIARGDKPLVEFVKEWNTACEKCGLIQNTCSYRALTDVKDLMNMGFTVKEALENAVLKASVPKDNLRSVLDQMKELSANPYYSTMQLIQEKMPSQGGALY